MSHLGDAADVNSGNSKTQNAFLFTVHAMFRYDWPPSGETYKYVATPSTKKIGEILYLLICSFLLCLSWLLRSRVRKFRRDSWITLYIYIQGSSVEIPLQHTRTWSAAAWTSRRLCYRPAVLSFTFSPVRFHSCTEKFDSLKKVISIF